MQWAVIGWEDKQRCLILPWRANKMQLPEVPQWLTTLLGQVGSGFLVGVFTVKAAMRGQDKSARIADDDRDAKLADAMAGRYNELADKHDKLLTTVRLNSEAYLATMAANNTRIDELEKRCEHIIDLEARCVKLEERAAEGDKKLAASEAELAECREDRQRLRGEIKELRHRIEQQEND